MTDADHLDRLAETYRTQADSGYRSTSKMIAALMGPALRKRLEERGPHPQRALR